MVKDYVLPFFEMGYHCDVQVGLEFLDSRDPSMSASQMAVGKGHHAHLKCPCLERRE